MEKWDDLFKKSIEQDRGFPVEEQRWLTLERELNQSKRKRLIGWWFLGFAALGFLGTMIHFNASSNPAVEAFKILQEKGCEEIAADEVEKPSISTSKTLNTAKKKSGLETGSILPKPLRIEKNTSANRASKVSASKAPTATILNQPSITPELALKSKLLLENNALSSTSARKKPSRNYDFQKRSYSAFAEKGATGSATSTTIESVKLEPLSWVSERKASWVLSANIQAASGNFFGAFNAYSTEPVEGVAPVQFIKSDGERLKLYQTDFRFGTNNSLELRYQLALMRQFRSGINVQVGMGYASHNLNNSRYANQLESSPDLFYMFDKNNIKIWMIKLGFQYTFLKRKRLQPYLGLMYFKTFSQQYDIQRWARMPATQFEEITERYTGGSGIDFKSGTANLFLETGFQYRINERLSIGANTYLERYPTRTTPLRLGFGIETRYRF